MGLRDFFQRFWPFKPDHEQQIRKLLQQIDCALEDLKIRIGESFARESALIRKLDQQTGASADPDNSGSIAPHKSSLERADHFQGMLDAERVTGQRLQQILVDLSEQKKHLEFSFQQGLARRRSAETLNLISSLKKDFGNDITLNSYLNKFSEESFKIEFTAESRLRIENLFNGSDSRS